MRRGLTAAGTLLVLALTACGGAGNWLEVTDVRIGQPTGPNAALYLTVTDNGDTGDILQAATTGVATSVELHETIENDDGTVGMQPVDAQLEVGPGGTERLEPGGRHLMLVDVDRLEVGETVTVTLQWQNSGDMEVEAEVVEPQEVLDHEDHG